MGGSSSKDTDCDCGTMTLDESREAWFNSLVIDQKINSTGEALQTCFSLIEGSWSRRSETFRFVHDTKLWHALTSCRSILNLAIESEKNESASSVEFWFWMNMVTSGIATLLLVFSSYFYKKLRDSRTVRRTCNNLLNLTSRNDSTAWGKSMEITDSGVPTAKAWYRRSISEKSLRIGTHKDSSNSKLTNSPLLPYTLQTSSDHQHPHPR